MRDYHHQDPRAETNSRRFIFDLCMHRFLTTVSGVSGRQKEFPNALHYARYTHLSGYHGPSAVRLVDDAREGANLRIELT